MSDKLRAAAKTATVKNYLTVAEPEPVGKFSKFSDVWKEVTASSPGQLLYAAPPRREWVSLTDEEISAVDWKRNETLHDYSRSIEAKLREKNT